MEKRMEALKNNVKFFIERINYQREQLIPMASNSAEIKTNMVGISGTE